MTDAKLSYILATDSLATVRGVVEHLARQTRADRVELVLISPAALGAREALAASGLGAVLEVRCESPLRLAAARALGVQAASAPYVFLGETHSFPEPELVESLLEGFAGPWSAVVPALVNANPRAPTSCAGFLLDYGVWDPERPAEEVETPLVYNAAHRREALLGLGERLAAGLSAVDHDLWRELAAGGHRARFEPAARIRHLNVAAGRAFARERFLCGVRLGLHRAHRWPLARRLLYAAAAPLAAAVLAQRSTPAIRTHLRHGRLPRGTLAWIAAALALRVTGEALGYLGFAPRGLEAELTELELHKSRYAGAT